MNTAFAFSPSRSYLGGDVLAGNMEHEITKIGVQVKKGVRAERSKTLANGKTEVMLSDGSKIVTDLYLPTMGLQPNTEWVDKKHLNEHNYVEVDEFYRVKNAEDVWACGDIVSTPRAAFMITDKQVRSFPFLTPPLWIIKADFILGRRCCQEHRARAPGKAAGAGQADSHGHPLLRCGEEPGRGKAWLAKGALDHGVGGQGKDAGPAMGTEIC